MRFCKSVQPFRTDSGFSGERSICIKSPAPTTPPPVAAPPAYRPPPPRHSPLPPAAALRASLRRARRQPVPFAPSLLRAFVPSCEKTWAPTSTCRWRRLRRDNSVLGCVSGLRAAFPERFFPESAFAGRSYPMAALRSWKIRRSIL